MCGIAGYVCFADKTPTRAEISKLFEIIEPRGGHASGIAYWQNKKLIVKKAAGNSIGFNASLSLGDTMPTSAILHTRYATKGVATENVNNHPLEHNGVIVVHNGVLTNDDEILRGHARPAVDSYAIAYLMGAKNKSWKEGIKAIEKQVLGSYCVASLSRLKKSQLCLIRKGNPLEIAIDTKRKIMFFASINLRELRTEKEKVFGFTFTEKNKDWVEIKMPDESYKIIGEAGLLSEGDIDPKRPNYNFYNQNDFRNERAQIARSYLVPKPDEMREDDLWIGSV